MELNEWENESTEKKEVSIAEITQLMENYRIADAEYKKLSMEVKSISVIRTEAGEALMSLLREAGLKTFSHPTLGKATLVDKYTVTTPKSHSDKAKLFNWLKEKGDDFFYTYVSVNSQTLNKLYNDTLEDNPEEEIPGLQMPGVRTSLSLTKR